MFLFHEFMNVCSSPDAFSLSGSVQRTTLLHSLGKKLNCGQLPINNLPRFLEHELESTLTVGVAEVGPGSQTPSPQFFASLGSRASD